MSGVREAQNAADVSEAEEAENVHKTALEGGMIANEDEMVASWKDSIKLSVSPRKVVQLRSTFVQS